MERRILKEQLETVNQSIFYLMLIILSVFLSFWSVLLQREQLKGGAGGKLAASRRARCFPHQIQRVGADGGRTGFFLFPSPPNLPGCGSRK